MTEKERKEERGKKEKGKGKKEKGKGKERKGERERGEKKGKKIGKGSIYPCKFDKSLNGVRTMN